MNPKNSALKRILLIEDEPDILFSLKMFLESEGFEVSAAQNGEEGMRILETQEMPELILLDMKMPVMSGWDFCREFINTFDHKAPLVVMTAAADAAERAKEAQATGWLGKPFTLDELLTKVNQHLKK
jgi:DNA-binding response OmpR family regulator